jgi:hypothetical protein
MELIMNEELSNYRDYMIENLFLELDNFNIITEAYFDKNMFKTLLEKIKDIIRLLKEKVQKLTKRIKGDVKKSQDEKALNKLRKDKIKAIELYPEGMAKSYIHYVNILSKKKDSRYVGILLKTLKSFFDDESLKVDNLIEVTEKVKSDTDYNYFLLDDEFRIDVKSDLYNSIYYADEIFEFSIKNIETELKELKKLEDYLKEFEKIVDNMKYVSELPNDNVLNTYLQSAKSGLIAVKFDIKLSTDLYLFYRNIIQSTYIYVYGNKSLEYKRVDMNKDLNYFNNVE